MVEVPDPDARQSRKVVRHCIKGIIAGLPRRKLMRQQAPGTVWSREIWLYASPLGVGEVSWVSLSHAC